jgi:hypothetical protein
MSPLPLLLSALALLPLKAASASASLPAIGRESAHSASANEADRASPAAAPVALLMPRTAGDDLTGRQAAGDRTPKAGE